MADISIYTGSFNPKSGTGDQVIAGIVNSAGAPFTPKAIIFWGLGWGTGFQPECRVVVGFDDGASPQGMCADAHSLFGANECASGSSSTYSLIAVEEQFASATLREAKIVGFGMGSFTLTYDSNTYTGDTVHYVAVGGADLDVKVGSFVPTNSTSPQVITGIGFTPTAILFGRRTADNPGTGTVGGWGGFPSPGFMAGPTQQGAAAGDQKQPAVSSLTYKYQKTSRSSLRLTAGAGTVAEELNCLSLDADGFTVQASGAAKGGGHQAYVAFGGIGAEVGAFTVPASTGTHRITSSITDAVLLLLMSDNAVASDSVSPGFALTLGMSDGVRQHSVWYGAPNAGSDSCMGSGRTSAYALSLAEPGDPGVNSTVLAGGQVTTLTPPTMFFNPVDGAARQVLYFVLGHVGSATLTIKKVTVPPLPSRTFDFTAGPGMTPAYFSLHHGQSRVYSNLEADTYTILERPAAGWVTSYVVSNGNLPSAIVLAEGDSVIVTVTNTLPSIEELRVRRSPHVNDEKQTIFCSRFELDLQAGLGTTDEIVAINQYTNPTVMLRVSYDGGRTWGQQHFMGAGAVGQYLYRCYETMLGSSRDFVFEVSVSDPVLGWYLVNAYADFEKGVS